MSTSRTMAIRQIHIDAAAKRKAIMDARNARTVEITRLWREGFAQLKADNDRFQRERDETFRSDTAEVWAWVNDMMEGVQQ